jgi:hypothetical protein
MSNIFDAKLRVVSETGLSDEIWNEVKDYIGKFISYDDDYLEETDNEEDTQRDYYTGLKWSLDYVKEDLQKLCTTFNVSLQARGEEEGVGFYEVIEISSTGEIVRHEELGF